MPPDPPYKDDAVKDLTLCQQSNLRALCRLFWGFVMCTSAVSWIKPFLDSSLKQVIVVLLVISLI